ncbi:MAG: mannose-1-phosphate guanylyltransferase, partial [Candidatus Omnitrophota bacterium]
DYIEKDNKGNVSQGNVVISDAKDSVFIGNEKHLIAAIGLKDIVVIHTDDATLICPKDKVQDVKNLVGIIEKKGLEKYL